MGTPFFQTFKIALQAFLRSHESLVKTNDKLLAEHDEIWRELILKDENIQQLTALFSEAVQDLNKELFDNSQLHLEVIRLKDSLG